MIASLKTYLLANVTSIPRWFEAGVEPLNSRTILDGPFGVLELGSLRPHLNNRHGGVQEIRIAVAWRPNLGAPDALNAACEEIRRKLDGAVIQRDSEERYTLEWAQTSDVVLDGILKALVQTVILSAPLRV